MNEVEFAKFPDEFNVAKHLDLGDGPLLLLLRSERVVVFVVDWRTNVSSVSGASVRNPLPGPKEPQNLTFNISGAVLKFILKFGDQQSSEGLKDKETRTASQRRSPPGEQLRSRQQTLTVLCFWDVWISDEELSKLGASSAKRRHS